MGNPGDRRVHAIMADGSALVRYDRAGRWYQEWPAEQMIQRRMLRVDQAVTLATSPEVADVNFGMPGGGTFDQKVRAKTRVSE